MNRWYLSAGLLLCLAPFSASQTSQQGATTPDKPVGTKVTDQSRDTIVHPQRKKVGVDSGVVKAAQKALSERGYEPGPADGSLGPRTQAALTKFQANEKINQTGKLDENTLERLNVGGAQTIGASPSDLGRGGKAAGHNVKEGHPIEAGKAAGSGAANFGKKVAKGTKSMAVEGAEKTGKGISTLGKKITGKTQGTEKEQPTPESDNRPPAAGEDQKPQ